MSDKSQRFYSVLVAFQHFAGKSMKSLDHANVLTEEEMTAMENGLRKLAVSLGTEDKKKWPDLHTLAQEITKYVPEIPIF